MVFVHGITGVNGPLIVFFDGIPEVEWIQKVIKHTCILVGLDLVYTFGLRPTQTFYVKDT